MNKTPDQLQADLMADTVAFPVLSAAELEQCTEFGTRCSFAPGEEIFGAGSQSFDRVTLICSLAAARSVPVELRDRLGRCLHNGCLDGRAQLRSGLCSLAKA